MNFRTNFLLSLLILSLSSLGCGDKLPVDSDTGGSVIMPLAKGNMWIGTLTTYAGNGSVLSTEPDTIMVRDELTIYVTDGQPGSQDLEPQTWYLCDNLEVPDNEWRDNNHTWYRNTSKGLEICPNLDLIMLQGKTRDRYIVNRNHLEIYLLSSYPASEGDTCGTFPPMEALVPTGNDSCDVQIVDEIVARYVEATNVSRTVPAGSHSCFAYSLRVLEPENAQFIRTALPWRYLSPDIGPVTLEWYQGGSPAAGRMTQKWELVEARLN